MPEERKESSLKIKLEWLQCTGIGSQFVTSFPSPDQSAQAQIARVAFSAKAVNIMMKQSKRPHYTNTTNNRKQKSDNRFAANTKSE